MLMIALLWMIGSPGATAATVMLDPGHGGHDPGAVGHSLREKEIALDIALRVGHELAERGFDVRMTRTEDVFLSLRERVRLAVESDADLFVSIHVNAHADKRAHGSLVLYYDRRYPQPAYPASREMEQLSEENEALARAVLDGLLAEAGTADRGIVPSAAYVIRNGRVPSILVETAFVSNATDAALLASESWRARAARGIAAGIAAYVPPVFPDIAGHWAKKPIERLEKLSLVGGTGGAFEPDRAMTRAEFLVLLDRVFGYSARETGNPDPGEDYGEAGGPSPEESGGETGANGDAGDAGLQENPVRFSDLPESHWAYGHLAQAVRLGLVNGYGDGLFRPDDPVSRAEMAVLLHRLTRLPPPDDGLPVPFADVPPDSWYAEAVAILGHHGLIRGVKPAEFQPGKRLTRAEAAAIVDRFLYNPAGQPAAARL